MSVKHLSKLFVIIALTAVQFTPLRAQETATQPKVITLKVTADRADALYGVGELATFSIEALDDEKGCPGTRAPPRS